MRHTDATTGTVIVVLTLVCLGLALAVIHETESVTPVIELCAEAVLITDSIKLCKDDYNCPLTAKQYEDWITAYNFQEEYCSDEREASSELEEALRSKEAY